MPVRRIDDIEIAPSGSLLVRPESEGRADYGLIYRAANGLRWDAKEQALHAWEPDRWEHAELLRHIVQTLADECGITLQISESTRWINISQAEQASLATALVMEPPDA